MLNYILQSDEETGGKTYWPYFGSDYSGEGELSTNQDSYRNLLRDALDRPSRPAEDIVVALTDSSDLRRVPTDEAITRINYDRDRTVQMLRRSSVSIHSVIHRVFGFRVFMSDFLAQSRLTRGRTNRVSMRDLGLRF